MLVLPTPASPTGRSRRLMAFALPGAAGFACRRPSLALPTGGANALGSGISSTLRRMSGVFKWTRRLPPTSHDPHTCALTVICFPQSWSSTTCRCRSSGRSWFLRASRLCACAAPAAATGLPLARTLRLLCSISRCGSNRRLDGLHHHGPTRKRCQSASECAAACSPGA